jgi:predicted AlkP superfamily phosphohydrolase/phosphomutase
VNKVLLIGVDALDAAQVEQFADWLPNISRLQQEGYYTHFESVWPPDSETAWASIYTGWNPARHGIFQFVDPLEKTATYVMRERDNSVIAGRTFWDIAGDAGRRVCVLFPHIGYPSWPVNGLMVTRASLDKEVSVTPPEMKSRYRLEGLNEVKGLAGRRREEYLTVNRRQVERQLELNVQLLREGDWDLFFSYWSALDLIQHQFWNYCDPQDPTYLGDTTPFRHAIRDFYILHDRVIGELIAEVDSNTSIILLSDHGHGMRPVKVFNINRLLREQGLLVLKHSDTDARVNLLKQVKNDFTDFVGRHKLGGIVSKLLKWMPWTKKLYLSAADLDLEQTTAYITDMSGIKAYSYGGIRIVQQNLNGRSYESVLEQIRTLLLEARDPERRDEPLVRWIKPRDELYTGPYIEEYPDLVFELNLNYGAGWDATGALFDVSFSHSLYPGSHLRSNAVFALTGPDSSRVDRAPDSLMDIAPTVLDILGIPTPKGMDGRSVLKPRD